VGTAPPDVGYKTDSARVVFIIRVVEPLLAWVSSSLHTSHLSNIKFVFFMS
jgi:hypothetical protein